MLVITPRSINILADLVSNRPTLNSTVSNTQRANDIANMLFENMKSILDSVFHSFENNFAQVSNNVFFSRMIHFTMPIHRESGVLKYLITLRHRHTFI